MIRKAKSLKVDAIIVMTDPPLLNYWAAKLLKKQRWALWSMDLYPEAFAASNLTTKKSRFYGAIDSAITQRSPSYLICLGPHQLAYLNKKFDADIPASILPCGIFRIEETDSTADHLKPDWCKRGRDKIIFAYCGNLGEAHSIAFLQMVAEQLNPVKHLFVLSIYGTKAAAVTKLLESFPGIIVVDSVRREHLSLIDIHLSSLTPEWVNVCVPSKTVSAICSQAAFLYCGPEESDNWSMFRAAGWRIDPDSIKADVIRFFQQLNMQDLQDRKAAAVQLQKELFDLKLSAFKSIEANFISVVSD